MRKETAMTSIDDRHDSRSLPLRVLVAVHGYETPGWGPDTARVVARWTSPIVRVLALLSVPSPPRTSLWPLARRTYDGARAAWRRLEEERLQQALDAVVPSLPRTAEIVRQPCLNGDIVATITGHVEEWPADVIVIGAPAAGLRNWVWPGPIHQKLLRRAPCAVLVTPSPAPAARRPVRVVPSPRPGAAPRRA
jgi:nucleotide-binding universal stress UspA family protein